MYRIHVLASLLVAAALIAQCTSTVTNDDQPEAATIDHPQYLKGDSAALTVARVIDAMGGVDQYKALTDIEYTYTYRNVSSGKQDVSIERYKYDCEKSWARYDEHTYTLLPDRVGTVIQGFNGKTTWTTLNDTLLTDSASIRRADFLRKTNFYWLNMMFKLLDPGTILAYRAPRLVDGIEYEVVEVKFGENVGDAQDIYLLYIHPETHFIDQFLFTVMDFGRAEPLLMQVQYEEHEGLSWPVYRRYTPANWEGEVPDDAAWVEELSAGLKFDTGIDDSLFETPAGN